MRRDAVAAGAFGFQGSHQRRAQLSRALLAFRQPTTRLVARRRTQHPSMGKGKFKGKPTGFRNFSTPEEIDAGVCACPSNFRKENLAKDEEEVERIESEDEEEYEDEPTEKIKRKGTEGLIQIDNPNLVKPKNIKAKQVDLCRRTELSRREREEIEKQKAHERCMKLQEQGKTEQAKKDLERLAEIRQQRAEAAKRREEEKAVKEQKKAEALKRFA